MCCYNNYPESIHDSILAKVGKLYEKLMKVYNECNGRCTADSAFTVHGQSVSIFNKICLKIEEEEKYDG
jgi:hypothetical protein